MKLVIFDLDGTLLDTVADLADSVNHCLCAHGFPQHSFPEYKQMIGRGMRNLVTNALPAEHRDDTFVDGFLKEFLDWYLTHIDIGTRPYPGIPEVLAELDRRGVKMAVASNKLQSGTERLIRGFFPDIPFVAICGNSPSFPLKPDPALVRYIMSQAGVSEADTVVVGDSGIDIQTARNAGVRIVAVSWGFRPVADLSDADVIVSSSPDLLAALV